MVKKLGILGFILVVVAATGMVWAETFTGSIPAPQPMVAPAAAPACVGPACPPPPKVKMAPKKLRTSIQVKMQYPEPTPPPWRSVDPLAVHLPPFLWRCRCGDSSFLGRRLFTIFP